MGGEMELVERAFELFQSDAYEQVLPLVDDETVNLDPVSFEDVGAGRVIVEFAIRARGRASGIEASQPAVAGVTVAKGKVRRIEFFTDVAQARARLG